ncbi:MAG: 4-alpha-glucanotransferase [Desulfuromonadales bacterium GWD2_61_12]|nr:MAG: 4-alpha-glucanotransferase [Desulfuromonadales bacterium GWC2_61_20]OGR34970.1 MAG: 4-alpha-glucanotransferase [Desulfuromonadales bacterium GWD2_61_12]HAD04914.1 4-alpha-glucanotransferase [Desulfuromonas sp.]HBT83530.1 4-alpha-glucanotransferase [Desulfuromonas sp.]
MMQRRASGLLLHPTSLPGPFGLGSLGSEAYRFVDFLRAAGQTVWQILPLSPTGYGDSPYSAYSAFAGNSLLISLERLVEAGDLAAADLAGIALPEGVADYAFAHACKGLLLPKAAAAFAAGGETRRRNDFARFCSEQAFWLEDYTLFRALHQHFAGTPWTRWPEALRRREAAALDDWRRRLDGVMAVERYGQFIFFEQWFALKTYANSQGVRFLGDMPIFVAFDSAEVWTRPELFHLDAAGEPTVVAGVPPDYFSATGQRWGNPLYRWERMAADNFSWWRERLRWALVQTDLVRIDHFRGFAACWAIPATEPTAENGVWWPVPGGDLFAALTAALGPLPLVAEDLGVITPDVEALRASLGYPGMKVLQFAFGSGADNPHLPHNLQRDAVIYSGTHDNDTVHNWWRSQTPALKAEVRSYLGSSGREIGWELIRLASSSVAGLCIFPLQDLLDPAGTGRLNLPGVAAGNWRWRYRPDALSVERAERLRRVTTIYGRC